jgi:hypothetical protein
MPTPKTTILEAWAAWNMLKDTAPIAVDPDFGTEDEAVDAVREMLDRHIEAIELRTTIVGKTP